MRGNRVMRAQVPAGFEDSEMAQVCKFDLNQGPAAAAANYITQCVDTPVDC